METPKKPAPERGDLSDSFKLAIREEVEHRFEHPTASLVKMIEDEVRTRVRRQEWYYWIILVLLGAFAAVYWHHTLSEIPKSVDAALATTESLATQAKIGVMLTNSQDMYLKLTSQFTSTMTHADEVKTNLNELVKDVKSTADIINADLSQIPTTVNTNLFVPMRSRLDKLKQQDNILLIDDLPKLFVRETVTNIIDNNTIILGHEPISSTVKIYSPTGLSRIFVAEDFGYLQGKGIVLTNITQLFTAQVLNHIQSGGVEVEYIRKSLHD